MMKKNHFFLCHVAYVVGQSSTTKDQILSGQECMLMGVYCIQVNILLQICVNRQMIANCQIFVLFCVVGMVWSYTYSSYGVASPSSIIYCVDISPDGELVAVGTDEPFIKIYYLDNQTLVSSVGTTAVPRSVKFSPDQSFLIATTQSVNIYKLSDANFQTVDIVVGYDTVGYDVDIDSTSSYFVVCGSYGQITFWSDTLTETQAQPVDNQTMRTCQFAYDDSVVVGMSNGSTFLYDSGLFGATEYQPTGSDILSVSFLPDSHTYIVGSADEKGYISTDSTEVGSFGGNVWATATSRAFLAYGTAVGQIHLYTHAAQFQQTLPDVGSTIMGLDFSDNGRVLVAVGDGVQIHIFEGLYVEIQDCVSYNSVSPYLCIDCQLSYYVDDKGECSSCEEISSCVLCNATDWCTYCMPGYVADEGHCQNCDDVMEGCLLCQSTTVCLECDSQYYLDNTTELCEPCTNLPSCISCQSDSQCVQCTVGFFLNSTSQCSQCPPECLTCSGEASCTNCQLGYYLSEDATCELCFTNCLVCDDYASCQMCTAGYQLSDFATCEKYSAEEASATDGSITISFQSYYENKTTLLHVLFVEGAEYLQENMDWNAHVSIYIVNQDKTEVQLQIQEVTWASSIALEFYTDNKFDLEEDSIERMAFARLLAGSSFPSTSSIAVSLSSHFLKVNLPDFSSSSALTLEYNLSEPQFVATLLSEYNNYQFHLVGIIVVTIIFIKYSTKVLLTSPKTFDKGQIIPHILALKVGGFILYPTYMEFYDFCYGFMVADFPWANIAIGNALGDPLDIQPYPHSLFFVNMNLASTYLLALVVFGFLAGIAWIVSKFTEGIPQQRAHGYIQFLYWFFIFGCTFSGCTSLQGAILNPITTFNANVLFYSFGILLYFACVFECLYFLYRNPKPNICKARVIVKATLLSLAHFNPILFVSFAFTIDITLLIFQYNYSKVRILRSKKLKKKRFWGVNHALTDIALIIILFVPQIMLSIVSCIVLLLLILGLQSFFHYQEVKNEEQLSSSSEEQQSQNENNKKSVKKQSSRIQIPQENPSNLTEQNLKEQSDPIIFIPIEKEQIKNEEEIFTLEVEGNFRRRRRKRRKNQPMDERFDLTIVKVEPPKEVAEEQLQEQMQ